MKVHVWIGKSPIAGKGLFAGQDIKKETIITRYLGTKMSKAQSAHALAQGNAYICSLNDRYDIDGNVRKYRPLYQSFLRSQLCLADHISGYLGRRFTRYSGRGRTDASVQLCV